MVRKTTMELTRDDLLEAIANLYDLDLSAGFEGIRFDIFNEPVNPASAQLVDPKARFELCWTED